MIQNQRNVLNIAAHTYPPSREASAMRGALAVCVGARLVLRVVDVDGVGGLTAVKMVKYAVSDDGKNGQF